MLVMHKAKPLRKWFKVKMEDYLNVWIQKTQQNSQPEKGTLKKPGYRASVSRKDPYHGKQGEGNPQDRGRNDCPGHPGTRQL